MSNERKKRINYQGVAEACAQLAMETAGHEYTDDIAKAIQGLSDEDALRYAEALKSIAEAGTGAKPSE